MNEIYKNYNKTILSNKNNLKNKNDNNKIKKC